MRQVGGLLFASKFLQNIKSDGDFAEKNQYFE
jgi:hypothetical protein